MKRLALRPSEWPITAKVPMLVVVLMLAVSAVITNQVLSRLAESQRRHFDELAASYLDGLSSSLVPAVSARGCLGDIRHSRSRAQPLSGAQDKRDRGGQ